MIDPHDGHRQRLNSCRVNVSYRVQIFEEGLGERVFEDSFEIFAESKKSAESEVLNRFQLTQRATDPRWHRRIVSVTVSEKEANRREL